jgi:hypothetical protein
MNKTTKMKVAHAYKVEIFIGGDLDQALATCEDYCTRIGLCVTVEPVTFTYRGGNCKGVRVGLINYARFPSTQAEIWAKAVTLADILKEDLKQGSYTVQDHAASMFISTRDEDQ